LLNCCVLVQWEWGLAGERGGGVVRRTSLYRLYMYVRPQRGSFLSRLVINGESILAILVIDRVCMVFALWS